MLLKSALRGSSNTLTNVHDRALKKPHVSFYSSVQYLTTEITCDHDVKDRR